MGLLRGNDESVFPCIFHDPLLWIGFVLPFSIQIVDLNVGFSVWFFRISSRLHTSIFTVVGYHIKEYNEALTGSSIALSHQGMGAILVLVVAIAWTARDHLAQCSARRLRAVL